MAAPTQYVPRFDYLDVVETATKALTDLYSDRREYHDPADVDREAHKFASMLVDVFDKEDARQAAKLAEKIECEAEPSGASAEAVLAK